ncbi:hypothetical protein CEXT_186281 [Caerostris extrusa]|uniref:Uncharacterized protein n=1 Tax=Caerostris extrusa TaxID=172846 RepID=A0AAV4XSN3_CAEEX|nr:hypothetical protein CEXT_186281 [Caerostris extrusa]
MNRSNEVLEGKNEGAASSNRIRAAGRKMTAPPRVNDTHSPRSRRFERRQTRVAGGERNPPGRVFLLNDVIPRGEERKVSRGERRVANAAKITERQTHRIMR